MATIDKAIRELEDASRAEAYWDLAPKRDEAQSQEAKQRVIAARAELKRIIHEKETPRVHTGREDGHP